LNQLDILYGGHDKLLKIPDEEEDK